MGKRSETSSFGVVKREGHDASKFYSSKLYINLKIDDKKEIIDNSMALHKLKNDLFNKIINYDNFNSTIATIPKESIHLIIFILPRLYKKDVNEFDNWRSSFERLVSSLKRLLVTGGRLVIITTDEYYDNPKNYNKPHYFPFHAKISNILIEQNLILRGNIILCISEDNNYDNITRIQKINGFYSLYHFGIICSKDIVKRIKNIKKDKVQTRTDTITKDQFLTYTKSVWRYEPKLIQLPEKKRNTFDLAHQVMSYEMLDYIQRFANLFSFFEDNILYILPIIQKELIDYLINFRHQNIFLELPHL
ncbi:MAG: hypothetical protein ACTSU2_03190 [Promethearchaeota archaeon]